jgi:peptide deformylase
MAILTILQYPDPRLHRVSAPVDRFDEELQRLIRDMAETMYASNGIGLAATQVDVHRQLIVIDTSESRDQLRVFINPEIQESRGESELEEGCLSVPGIYDRVPRFDWVRGRAWDVAGREYGFEAQGLEALCIQHEMDHLMGRVFVDYLSRLKQTRIVAKLRKQQRRAG